MAHERERLLEVDLWGEQILDHHPAGAPASARSMGFDMGANTEWGSLPRNGIPIDVVIKRGSLSNDHVAAIFRNVGWNVQDSEVSLDRRVALSRWFLGRVKLQHEVDGAVGRALDVALTRAIQDGTITLENGDQDELLERARRRDIDGFRLIGQMAAPFRYSDFPEMAPLVDLEAYFRQDTLLQLKSAALQWELVCDWKVDDR